MIIWLMVILFFLGLFLILLEVVIPYGLSIIAGLAIIIVAIVLCFRHESFGAALFYSFLALVASGSATYWVYHSGMRMMMLKPQRITDKPSLLATRKDEAPEVGDLGEVLQPLRPTGTIVWHGKTLPARVLRVDLEIPIGAKVVIKGMDSIYYVVETRGDEPTQKPAPEPPPPGEHPTEKDYFKNSQG